MFETVNWNKAVSHTYMCFWIWVSQHVSSSCTWNVCYKKIVLDALRKGHWTENQNFVFHNSNLVTNHTVDNCELFMSVHSWMWNNTEADSDSSSEENSALCKDWTQLGKDKDVNFSPHIFINNKVDMCCISSISEHYDDCESGWCDVEQEKEVCPNQCQERSDHLLCTQHRQAWHTEHLELETSARTSSCC